MSLSPNAIKLLRNRYCHPGEQPKDVYKRIANALALGDNKFERKLEKAMIDGYFLPNSPCIRNAGIQKRGLLHACFILPLSDDIESITDTLKNMIIIFKHGGGVGINFSKLRPQEANLSGGGSSTGVVSFMKGFDSWTDIIKQGGFRRGALMGILNFEHAEIMNFIRSKLTGQLTNFNISVMISDKFMEKIEKEENIELINPQDGKVWTTINAKTIFDVAAFSAWNSGDPGFLFYDRINKDNPLFPKIKIKTTNPCITGDTLIAVADGRNAISIKQLAEERKNVPVYCQDITAKKGKKKVVIKWGRNFRLTGRKVKVYKIILDDDSSIKATSNHNFMLRDGTYKELKDLKIGDSLMSFNIAIHNGYITIKYFNHTIKEIIFDGYEDVYNLTVDDNHNYIVITKYNSDKSSTGICIKNCSEVGLPDYGACCLGSINISNLVKNNKFNFTLFSKYIELGTRALLNMNAISWYPLPQITKVMKDLNPIGLGIMGFADCLIKLGIYYNSDEALKFIDELSVPYIEITNKIAKDSFYKRIIAPTGSLSILANCSSGIEPVFESAFERHLTVGIIQETRDIYKSKFLRTAHQISPDWHLKIQAKWQEKVDGGISKTINLPNEASVDDVKKIYMDAWKMKVKGITVFREGCKGENQVLKKIKSPERGKCDEESCHL